MTRKLTLGETYDVSRLAFTGSWDGARGNEAEGYHVEDYFDAEGRYLGPDGFGIEPLFEDE